MQSESSFSESQRHVFHKWKIQILQGQMVPQTNYQLMEEGSNLPLAVATPL